LGRTISRGSDILFKWEANDILRFPPRNQSLCDNAHPETNNIVNIIRLEVAASKIGKAPNTCDDEAAKQDAIEPFCSDYCKK
jgi:hypothetical protein